jgi:hypothetical protein
VEVDAQDWALAAGETQKTRSANTASASTHFELVFKTLLLLFLV